MDHEHHNHGRREERHGERHGERRRRRGDRRERGLDFDARDFRRRHNQDEREDRPRNRQDRRDNAVIGAIDYRRNFLAHQRIHNNAIAEAEAAADRKLKELEEKQKEFEIQTKELESQIEHMKELKKEKEKTEKMEIEMEQAVQKLLKLQIENTQKIATDLVVGMKYKDEEAIATAAYEKEKIQRIENLKIFEIAKSEALSRGMAGKHFIRATARFRELEEEERWIWIQDTEAMAKIRNRAAVNPPAPQVGGAEPTAQAAPSTLGGPDRQAANPASPPPPLPIITLD